MNNNRAALNTTAEITSAGQPSLELPGVSAKIN